MRMTDAYFVECYGCHHGGSIAADPIMFAVEGWSRLAPLRYSPVIEALARRHWLQRWRAQSSKVG
jgi:hypothetical protein